MNYNYFAQLKPNAQILESNCENESSNLKNQIGIKIIEKIPQNDDEKLPILSVIVTFRSGCSYDNLFSQVRQVPPEGGRITLYEANLDTIGQLYSYLSGEIKPETITDETQKKVVSELLHEISDIESDCVLFNFECSSGCAGQTFHNKDATMKTIKYMMDRGSMVMVSDFAVKALINQWDETLLGSNPFKKLGECNNSISLAFKPEKLINSPSAQLKMVGELSSKGEAHIHALSGTIVFGVDARKVDSAKYDLEVLTIVTHTQGFNTGHDSHKDYLSEISNHKGTVGHAIVKYKSSNGILLLSAGHWIELSKLNVDVGKLESVAEQVGGEYYNQMMNIKRADMSEKEKFCQFEKLANVYVQQSAPCNYSKKANVNFSKKVNSIQEKEETISQNINKDIENKEIKNQYNYQD